MKNEKKIKEIGIRLGKIRKGKGLSAYSVSIKGGISISQVKSVEEGNMNYTIDTLLGYIKGCDLEDELVLYKR